MTGFYAGSVSQFDPAVRFAQAPVARLATVTPEGIPHLVPVVFAVDQDRVYTAVDAKPKKTQRLRRLTNIEHNPNVSLLADHYTADWTRLWWVRADGVATIHADDEAMRTGYRLLRVKYQQYQSVPLTGPVVVVAVHRWAGWHA
jgi:PPOX class probable F420-dependent enzyme